VWGGRGCGGGCRFRCGRLVGIGRFVLWVRGLVLKVEVVRKRRVGLVLRGVVGVRSSWVGRSLEVDRVRERLTEGWRRGWRVPKDNDMSTRLVKLMECGTIGEEHRYVDPSLVYRG
jgi:hypothetical protein